LHDNGGKANQGYVPLTNVLNQPIHSVDVSGPYEMDSLKISMFQLMIDDCKKRNIKLFIVFSPYYINQIGTDTSFKLGKAIAAKNNIDFIDYSKNELFLKSPQLFNDTIHVNTTGATIFSKMLASDIKKRLASK
jgi:lysophospholipase L1-like esterase